MKCTNHFHLLLFEESLVLSSLVTLYKKQKYQIVTQVLSPLHQLPEDRQFASQFNSPNVFDSRQIEILKNELIIGLTSLILSGSLLTMHLNLW